MTSRSLVSNLAIIIVASSLVSCALNGQTTAPKAIISGARLGMNLNGPADWNTELPFVDVFHFSREWISQKLGEGWGKGPSLILDADGYVTKLEPGCFAETILCTVEGGHYPSGDYTVYYDGKGKLDFGGAASVATNAPGKITIKVDAKKGSVFLRVVETDSLDHIRNIRVIMPGFETTYKTNPFHPIFLKRWQGMSSLRFMDWMMTNGSKVAKWADRPKLVDATYTTRGIPLELMIDLCNRQKADAWFCMPHRADDDYVRNFAQLVKQRLAPGLKVYIEYSNEVWNSGFEQNRYSQDKAKELKLGPAERLWEGGAMYYGKRSVEIFKIWTDVFGGHDRLVRVLAWQAAADAYWTDGLLLSQPGIATNADALAIAPYITMCIPPTSTDPKQLSAETVSKWTVDQVMDNVEKTALPEAISWITRQKAIANKYKLKLITYEGGQHLVGIQGGENNDEMTRLFQEANSSPRMGRVYTKYLAAWTTAGGDLFSYFSSTGSWSKWGSWGITQYYDDDVTKSPKFMSVMLWAKSRGQVVNLEK